jgi:hypothetical protein
MLSYSALRPAILAYCHAEGLGGIYSIASEPAKLLQQYANFAGGYVTQNGGPGSRPERSDGVKYQPENERPNRRSEIGATQGVLIIFLANRIGDRHE